MKFELAADGLPGLPVPPPRFSARGEVASGDPASRTPPPKSGVSKTQVVGGLAHHVPKRAVISNQPTRFDSASSSEVQYHPKPTLAKICILDALRDHYIFSALPTRELVKVGIACLRARVGVTSEDIARALSAAPR